MKTVLIINGPNLNMLGKREPDIYGHETLQDIERLCLDKARDNDMTLIFFQSNNEGDIVTAIQNHMGQVDGLIINAAAYTHTSVAIHDALKLHDVPIIEVHLSNPKEREEFRHFSYIEPLADKVFSGLGSESYTKAIDHLSTTLKP